MKAAFLPVILLQAALLGALSAESQSSLGVSFVRQGEGCAQELSPDEIVRRFTAKESELREVWKEYAYRQETKFQVLGPANTISGEFYQVSEFVFTDAGKRIERILKAPIPTLDRTGLRMSPEDRNALVNLQAFSLTTEELPNYRLNYVGREKIDDLNTYVFEVTPKAMTDRRALEGLKKQKVEGRYFQGRVWVDDQDFQIVKTAGKVVPEFEQRFPRFETYRENVNERYWLPTYTYGDDTLDFEGGASFHVRFVVRYTDYRRFTGDLKIIDAVEEPQGDAPQGKGGEKADKPEEKKESNKPASRPPLR
jgi:hypothetical protein